MSETDGTVEEQYASGHYQIRIKGHLEDGWADWFGRLSITRKANGETWLTGPLPDQAALHGVLRNVRDVGMSLLSVLYIEPDEGEGAEVEQQSMEADQDHSTKGAR